MSASLLSKREYVKRHKCFIAHSVSNGHSPPMKQTKTDARAAVSARVKLARVAWGPTVADFCRLVSINTNAWVQYESGTRRISVDEAEKVCDRTGLTLDWIYRGRRDTLFERVAGKIDAAALIDPATIDGRRRSKLN